MANTYTQLHVHCVFCPKYRAALLADEWSLRMRNYMSAVVHGYGAFTVGHRGIDSVCRYIHRQQEHHRGMAFRDEYRGMLQQAGIAYDERYVFRDPE